METEEWRVVPEYPRYEASSLGRIRGPRGISTGNISVHGYRRVAVVPGTCAMRRETQTPHKFKEAKVHRLVAMAFVPNPDGKETINHIDGDKLNNRPENLEWCSIQENVTHNVTELRRKSKATNKDYLTVDEIISIRSRAANGETVYAIAKGLGRNQGHIRDIVSRKTWKHL